MQDDHLLALLEAYIENQLTPTEADELRDQLRSSPAARQRFWDYVEQHALLEDVLGEARGIDLALLQTEEDSLSTQTTSQGEPSASGTSTSSRWRLLPWMVALSALAACLLLVIGQWSRQGARTDPDSETVPFATINAVEGDVQVCESSGKAIPVVLGSALHAGQFLAVGNDDDSRAEILLADGAQVTLSPRSTLRFVAGPLSQGLRIHLETGAAQVQSAPQSAELPLVVTTDHARISAQQTRFRLYREQQASRVELEEGKVFLQSQNSDRQVEVTQGQYVVATAEPQPMVTHLMPSGHCRLLHTLMKAGDAACFSSDGKRLVTSHFSRGLKLWSVADGKLQTSARGSGQRAVGLTFTGEGTVIALGDRGTALLWDVSEPQASLTRLREKNLRDGGVSGDGRWLTQGMSTGEVVIWESNPETGNISLRRTLNLKPSRVAPAWLGDPRVAVSRWGGDIFVIDVASGRELARQKMKRTPTPLALSADGRFLSAYANDDGLILFDLKTSERRHLWPGEGARVACLTFSADGRLLLAGLDDGTVRAWASDGRSLLVLDTGNWHVNKVAVTADLSLLATVGDGDCVKIWEIVVR